MYQLLPRNDLENDDASGEDIKTPELGSKRPSLFLWALAACVVCTIANFASIYIYPPSRTLPQSVAFLVEPPRLTRQQISRLRHPTQFIGLDRIHKYLASDVEPFINKPFLTARVDESAPDKCFFDVDQRSYTTPVGTVFPEQHRIRVTPTVSTILQFRSIDYGMEACELKISLPAVDDRDEEDKAVGRPGFMISDPPITLHLSQLDAPFALDPTEVSFRTQPSVLHDLGDLFVRDLPVTFTHNFTCVMEEVFTFKLECQSSACNVELWQDNHDDQLGRSPFELEH